MPSDIVEPIQGDGLISVVFDQFVEPFGKVNSVFLRLELQIQVYSFPHLQFGEIGMLRVGKKGEVPLRHLMLLHRVQTEGKFGVTLAELDGDAATCVAGSLGTLA